jgi:hypothetical protein
VSPRQYGVLTSQNSLHCDGAYNIYSPLFLSEYRKGFSLSDIELTSLVRIPSYQQKNWGSYSLKFAGHFLAPFEIFKFII